MNFRELAGGHLAAALRLSLLLFLCCVFHAFRSSGQSLLGEYGRPSLRIFKPTDYKASDQNWAVVQDGRGLVYVGNNENGVLEYDGVSWRQIPVRDNKIVRSLAVGSSGVVYVGTVGDFGRLVPDEKGSLHYESLFPLLGEDLQIGPLHKTYVVGDEVYFCASQWLFQYSESSRRLRKIEVPTGRGFLSFRLGESIYVGQKTDTIQRYANGVFSLFPMVRTEGAQSLDRVSDIYGMVPLNGDTVLLGTYPNGLFFMSRRSGEVKPAPADWASELQALIRDGVITYAMKLLPNGRIGLGLIYDQDLGYAEVDAAGRMVLKMGVHDGLLDPFVVDFTMTGDGTLWLMQGTGIVTAETQSAFREFAAEDGIDAPILSMIRFEGRLYVGTMKGLLYQTYVDGCWVFRPVEGISMPIWSLGSFYNPLTAQLSLLALGMHEFFEVRGLRGLPLDVRSPQVDDPSKEGMRGGYKLCLSAADAYTIFVGRQEGVSTIRLGRDGHWYGPNDIPSLRINDEVRGLCHTSDSVLWGATYGNGYFAAKERGDGSWDVRAVGLEQGLPTLRDASLGYVGDSVVLCTPEGMYRYDFGRDTVQRVYVLEGSRSGVSHLAQRLNDYVVQRFNSSNNTHYLEHLQREHDTLLVSSKPFRRLPQRWADVLYWDPDGPLWVAFSDRLYSYDMSVRRDYDRPFRSYVRSIRLMRADSLIFNGTHGSMGTDSVMRIVSSQPPSAVSVLPYRHNAIQFEVGCNFYEGEGMEYSYLLENNDEEWSKWDTKHEFTLMNLREGKYTLKVRARNLYGVVSEVDEYRFVIRPPFYRTIWAYLVYAIFTIGVVWGITIINTRRLKREKQHLEDVVLERTLEVVQQKEQIEQQNEEIVSSINYASKIQVAVLPSKERMDEFFPDHFLLFLPRDIVSGDFYWVARVGHRRACAIADCTGHGVPGAFMSMLGSSFLHQIVRSYDNLHTDEILNELRRLVITSLRQTTQIGSSKDGMDMVLFIIDDEARTVEYSGANNPLVIIRGEEIIQLKADKMPVGIYIKSDEPFTRHVVELEPGDVLYAFSDGYPDQFGGPSNRKFMVKKLKELFVEIHTLPMPEQREILHRTLVEWQGEQQRIDDVIVFGTRV